MKEIQFRGQHPDDVKLIDCLGSDRRPFQMARASFNRADEIPDTPRLAKFLKTLIARGHLTPFEHCVLTYRIDAPIFVFRQLFRHRTAVISERSLRYTEADLCFYEPLYYDPGQYRETTTAAARSYNEALKDWPKERARIILPTSLFSFAFFTINLRNLFNLLRQRAAPSAQPETRFIAERMQAEAARMYPLSMAAYEEAYPKAGPS